MATGLFGVPVGLRAYQDDQIKLSELALRQKQVDSGVRLNDAQAANFAADNARLDAEAKDKRETAADAARVREALGRLARGEPAAGGAPTAGPLEGGSEFDAAIKTGMSQVQYLQSIGDVDGAAKVLKQLTGGVQDLAQARQAASAAKENDYDIVSKRHEGVAKFLSGVTDQVSYDAAKLQLRINQTLSEEDLAEMPDRYSPVFVRSAIAGTAAAKQKADLEREASRTAVQNMNDRDQINNRKLTRDLAERAHKLAVDREDRLAKQGEARIAALGGKKPLGAPMPREIAAVTAELKRLGIKVETDMTPALRNDLVEEVRERIRSGAQSWGEATAAVVAEMEADGRLEESMIGRDEYKPDGKTAGRALAMPATPAELKPNTYYTLNGETRLFDGQKFVKGAGK
jgi:hypothetical protein